MHRSTFLTRQAASALLATSFLLAPQANATVVEFQTVLGSFSVNLFDDTTPQTVANFLDYVNNGAYTDSIVHRSEPNFVIQGGGFSFDGALPFGTIDANAPVINEPELSNVRGTIAMAKLNGQPDSATNQWFINLSNNANSLDGQNGGFTVFGIVMDDGMDIVDAIADLPRFGFGGAFGTLPLRDYDDPDVDPDGDNIVIINAVVVTDSSTTTNTDLLPPVNTIITTPAPGSDDGGGGAPALPGLVALSLLALRRRAQA